MKKNTCILALIFFACTCVFTFKKVNAVGMLNNFKEAVSDSDIYIMKFFLGFSQSGKDTIGNTEDEIMNIENEQKTYEFVAENENYKKQIKEKQLQQKKKEEEQSKKKLLYVKSENDNKDNDTKKEDKDIEAASFSEAVQAALGGNKLHYSWSKLTDFDYLIKNFYQVHGNTTIYKSQLNAKESLKKNFSINKKSEGPQILIYHTHGSEFFKDSDKNDKDTLITGVGEALAKILRDKYGYKVYHDSTVFPYTQSYSLGRIKAKELKEKYPSIQVIIDMHRDSAGNNHFVTDINGRKTAKIMFFNGMSQTKKGIIESRKNENLKDNLAFSLQLKLAAEQLYPGFTRRNYLKAYRYNMDLVPCYALIEVGAETNTFEEAVNAMEPLAKILNCVLR